MAWSARGMLALALAMLVPAGAARAAQGAAPAATKPSAPADAAPRPTLGPHAAALEGTWELVAMKLPDGTALKPPTVRGVIVIDRGVYFAASYLQPTSARTVGEMWEGQLIIEGDAFRVEPRKAFSFDSMVEDPLRPSEPPPKVSGTVKSDASALVFTKNGGGTVTFDRATSRRIQVDADGRVIEHQRTSLVPRIPEPPARGAKSP